VEVVAADLNDQRSLVAAFTGVYGVYMLTVYSETFDLEREKQQIKNQIAAAREAGVQHIVYSSAEDTRDALEYHPEVPLIHGYKVPMFDVKGEFNKVVLAELPATVLLGSFYYENFVYFGMGPRKNPDTEIYQIFMNMQDKILPMIAVDDIGRSALAIFKNKDEYLGKIVGIAGDFLTGDDLAYAFEKVLKIPVEYVPVTSEIYREFGFPGAGDLANMFDFKRITNDNYVKIRKSELISFVDFKSWLESHKHQILI